MTLVRPTRGRRLRQDRAPCSSSRHHGASSSSQQGRGHENPGGEKPRRHYRLARRGARRAADRHALRLRRRQRPGPGRQGGRRALPGRHAGRRGGRPRLQDVPGAHGGDRHAHELRRRPRRLLRQPRDAVGEPRQGRGAAGAGAQQAALRCRRRRPRARPAAGGPRLCRPRPRSRRRRAVERHGFRRPSLRPAGQRHAGHDPEDDARRPASTTGRAPSPRTTCGSSWWATSMPPPLRACSTPLFGQLPAKAKLTPVPPTQPAVRREAQGDRDGRAAVGGALRPAGPPAQGQGLHPRVRAQHRARRRRHVLAAVGGGAREARPRLFGPHQHPALQAAPRCSPAASPPRTSRSPSRWT